MLSSAALPVLAAGVLGCFDSVSSLRLKWKRNNDLSLADALFSILGGRHVRTDVIITSFSYCSGGGLGPTRWSYHNVPGIKVGVHFLSRFFLTISHWYKALDRGVESTAHVRVNPYHYYRRCHWMFVNLLFLNRKFVNPLLLLTRSFLSGSLFTGNWNHLLRFSVEFYVMLCNLCQLNCNVNSCCCCCCFSALSRYHQLLIGVLWQIVVHSEANVRSSAAPLFTVSQVEKTCFYSS